MNAKKAILAFCVLLSFAFSKSLTGQLNANFSSTSKSGCAPLFVQFLDSSSGSPTYWRWKLGNATSSFLQNPSVTYFDPGVYTVSLYVRNSSGEDSIVKTNYITVYAYPTVEIASNSQSGCYPLDVQFSDHSIPGSGTIVSWLWDFGDGFSSNQQNPVHTYTSSGNFNVTLQVINSNNCIKTLTRSRFININTGVNAGFTFQQTNSCTVPALINFTNTSTGTGSLQYKWLFGDGTTSTLQNPQHTYTAAGNYTVSLIVTNSNNCSDTMTVINAISAGAVAANFTSPAAVCKGSTVAFSNTSLPAPVSSYWSFGDGTFSNELSPVKSYTAAGVYSVKLVSNFGACTDSITKTITINQTPTAIFTADDTTNCSTPFTVHFNNLSTNSNAYTWNFGDGSSASINEPTHIYNALGTFSVQLICFNSLGCSDTITKNNYIEIKRPVVTLTNLPDSGCVPLTKNFTANVISDDPVVSYLWNFGNGSTSTEESPTYTYPVAGQFDVSVIITTASGCKDTAVRNRAITLNVKPTANFDATPRIQCAKDPIQFMDSTTGTVTSWYWDFGDGTTSIEQHPTHIYIDTGYFNIMLISYNGGCPDTLIIDSFVYINPPIAKFRSSLDCTKPLQRKFTDLSIGADEWHWDFGDGTFSTDPNPIHNFPAGGNYPVTLLVRNSITGCDYSITKNIRIVLVDINFTAVTRIICKNNSVTFTSNLSLQDVNTFEWDFGDGTNAMLDTNVISHVYTLAGTYTVRLITTDILGCKDTLTKPLYIVIEGPTAKFAPLLNGSCSNTIVQFSDSSVSDGSHPITSWQWNYGDGISEVNTAPPFQHAYLASGLYTIKLTVTDTHGCTDTYTSPTPFIISDPKSLFRASDTLTCPNHAIRFINQSNGGILQYKWYFGDGTTSTLSNPTHAYVADGLYTVSLLVINQYGCRDSVARIQYIKVITPVADFGMSDSVTTCPPLVVQFSNRSNPVYSTRWDFGDGTFATTSNPSHFYSSPGVFNVTLTITGPVGCTDIKRKTIVVNGPTGVFSYTPHQGCNPLTVNFISNTSNRVSFIWDFNDGNTLVSRDSIVSHTYTNPGSFLPKMILLGQNGCVIPILGLDTIHVKGIVPKFVFNSQVLCDSGLVQFYDSSAGNEPILTYNWYFGDGGTSHDKNPIHHYNSAGVYYPKLITISQSGCIDSIVSLIPVKVVHSPHIDFTSSPNGCVPVNILSSARITLPDNAPLTWSWNFGNGNTSNIQNPPAQNYSTAGAYTIRLIATNNFGCKDTSQKTVEAYPIPVVNAGVDTMICQKRGITMNATGADSIYKWSPAHRLSCTVCPNPVATPDSAINYFVTGITKHGCINKDTVLVRVKYPFKISYSSLDTLCAGETKPLFASGAYSYNWSPAAGLNNANIATPSATPNSTVTYQVIGTDNRKCFSDTGYVHLKVYPIPVVEAGADKILNAGFPLTIMPKISPDITSVKWSPDTAVIRRDYPGITINPVENIEYTVDVKNAGGCTATDKVKIIVLCDGSNIFIPNTFSPNSDGMNDIFYPRGTGLFIIKTFKIFSRWGELVFEQGNFKANDAAFGWNGSFKNIKLTNDVFVYTAEVQCKNGSTIIIKGNIAIVK